MSKLTIIIATFNAQSLIENALDSILKQEFDDWECIVIDGNSTDNTISIVNKFEMKDSRFSHISEPDNGIYDAFNKGWKLANGDWVYYMGADDLLLLEGMNAIFSSISIDDEIVYGNVVYKNSTGKYKHVKSNANMDSIRKRLNCAHQGFLMRKETIQFNKGFSEAKYKICADYDLILRSYINGARIRYIDADIAIFNTEGVSSSYVMELEGYKIRKSNRSVNVVVNVCLLIKYTIRYCVNFLVSKLK